MIQAVAELCRHFSSVEVILFGSRAKGTARERSDIDVAVSGVKDFDALAEAKPYESFQFVRQGYFCADVRDSKEGAPVFNRIVALKSSFRLPKQQ